MEEQVAALASVINNVLAAQGALVMHLYLTFTQQDEQAFRKRSQDLRDDIERLTKLFESKWREVE